MENTNFLKIIYFDEAFVADYMQIIAGGELKKTTEFVTEVSSGLSSHTEGGAGVSTEKKGLPKLFSFLSGVSLKAETEGEIDLSRTKDRIARNILENTLLADFVALLEADKKRTKNKRCSGIKIFPNVTMYPEVNSFSYLMLIAPFLQMMPPVLASKRSRGASIFFSIASCPASMMKQLQRNARKLRCRKVRQIL